MAFSQNRFGALLFTGDDEAEVDKLGNTKPPEKDEKQAADRPRRTHQPAMSPPSRRARIDPENFDSSQREQQKPDSHERKIKDIHRHGTIPGERGRQYDRRSGEVGSLGTKKKNEQSWGHLGQSELEAAADSISPNDPAAGDVTGDEQAQQQQRQQEEEQNVMTLDEYKKSHPDRKASLPAPRPANDGQEDPKWKDGVMVHRPDTEDYYSGKESSNKSRARTKKEKVFIDIDPPRHQSSGSRGRGGGINGRGRGNGGGGRGRGGRGGRGGNGGGGGRRGVDRHHNVNLADANAFPTLG